jgi:hypothetical protein
VCQSTRPSSYRHYQASFSKFLFNVLRAVHGSGNSSSASVLPAPLEAERAESDMTVMLETMRKVEIVRHHGASS